jgi:hypothetical protein
MCLKSFLKQLMCNTWMQLNESVQGTSNKDINSSILSIWRGGFLTESSLSLPPLLTDDAYPAAF